MLCITDSVDRMASRIIILYQYEEGKQNNRSSRIASNTWRRNIHKFLVPFMLTQLDCRRRRYSSYFLSSILELIQETCWRIANQYPETDLLLNVIYLLTVYSFVCYY